MATVEGPSTKKQKPNMSFSDQMRVYYKSLFPFGDFFRWISYGKDRTDHPEHDPTFTKRREICFTLEGDIFVRFKSFATEEDMAKAIRSDNPAKIDIGPIYNVDPSKRAAYQGTFAPVERELVFDIDMNDYNDVRSCCEGANVCTRCWPLMTCALKVIDACLRDDFGFEHIFWVFSGRRGIHAWVCDARARKLTEEQRGAIVEYLKVFLGKEAGKVSLRLKRPLHPSLARAREALVAAFEERLLTGQKLLETPEGFEKLLAFIPDSVHAEEIKEAIRDEWNKKATPEERQEDINVVRWRRLEKVQRTTRAKGPWLAEFTDRVVFAHAYPRLDVEVSKHLNHLLKAPFCVHPKTGKVCVPIDPEEAWEFDPTQVPTVAEVIEEMQAAQAVGAPADELWSRTAMAGAVETFRRCFLRDALRAEKAGKVQGGHGGAQGMDW